jgi:hypothetical protein
MDRVLSRVLAGVMAVSTGVAVQGGFAVTAMPVAAQTLPLAQQPVLIQEFQKLEDQWSIALVNKDQFALENLLAPTYIDVSSTGSVATRNERIADVLSGLPVPLLSVEQKVVNVRVVSDVAVVEGTYVIRANGAGASAGRAHEERGVFTHVYQRQRNSWACISGQRTAVVEMTDSTGRRRHGSDTGAAAPGTTGAAAPKQSKAEEPFHIPLLYKGRKAAQPATDGGTGSDAAAPGAPAPTATAPTAAAPGAAAPTATAPTTTAPGEKQAQEPAATTESTPAPAQPQ